MLICKNIKILLTSLFLIFNLTSCTHSLPRSESISSSRDISPDEKIFLSDYSFNNERNPADWSDNCTSYIAKFFRPKPNDNVFTKPLPELTQLNPEIKIFPNGKKYTQYKADINVMNKYPEYEDFLKETAEIIF